MEEQKDQKMGGRCGWWGNWCCCGAHEGNMQGHHHHGHVGFFILKVLIALFVLIVVFAIGVKIGEIRGYFAAYGYGDDYGYPMHMYGGYGNSGYGMPMMPYYGTQSATPSSTSR